MQKRRLVFMNGGKHFWNREKEIIEELKNDFDILLVINHSNDINYSIDQIYDFAIDNNITLKVIDFTNRKASHIHKAYQDFLNVIEIKKFKPDYIYIESFGSPFFAFFASLILNKKKVIFAILDYKLHPYGENRKIKLSEKIYQLIYLHSFRNFHLFSSEQASLMKKEHPSKNIFHIPLFLIKNDFNVKNSLDKKNKLFNFLFFGKIYFYKGVDVLIYAANILAQKRNDFKVTIAGRCTNLDKYKRLVKFNHIIDLRLDYVPKEEVPLFYANADILILPYREVTQSGPLMIAFNFHLLPLVSNIPGFLETIEDGYNGFVFDSESPNSLANKMEEILDMEYEKRIEIQNNLSLFVKNKYNAKTFAENYKSMFSSLSRTTIEKYKSK